MAQGTLSDFQRTGEAGSVVVSDTPNDCELYIIGSNLAGDRANAIVYYGESNPGTRDLDFSAFVDSDPVNITGFIYDAGNGQVDYLTNNLGPLPASPVPVAPTLIGFTRAGADGVATVSGVAVGDICEIWAIPLNSTERALVGSAEGTGAEQEIALDLSAFYGNFLGFIFNRPCLIEAVAKNADEACGPTSATISPIFLNPGESGIALALARDGTTITITVSGIGADDSALIGYTKLDGKIDFKIRNSPGSVQFTGMSQTRAYQFVALHLGSTRAWIGTATATEEIEGLAKPTLIVVNDGTGTSFTATVDGQANVTNHLLYRQTSSKVWLDGGSREGDGQIQKMGLTPGRYVATVYSSMGSALSLISDVAYVHVYSNTTYTVRERIIRYLQILLKEITPENGFTFKFESVERYRMVGLSEAMPSAVLFVPDQDKTTKIYPAVSAIMRARIDLKASMGDGAELDEKLGILAEAVEEQIGSDPKLGGIAHWTQVVRETVSVIKESHVGVISLSVNIGYAYNANNPYEEL